MLVKYTLFNKRPKVGDKQLYPLTAGRIALLQDELGNQSFAGDESVLGVYEVWLVSTLSEEELMEATEDLVAWKKRVKLFSLQATDEEFNAFGEIFTQECAAIAEKDTETVEKKTRSRAASGRKK